MKRTTIIVLLLLIIATITSCSSLEERLFVELENGQIIHLEYSEKDAFVKTKDTVVTRYCNGHWSLYGKYKKELPEKQVIVIGIDTVYAFYRKGVVL